MLPFNQARCAVAFAEDAMSGGTTDPDIDLVWPVLGEVWYNVMIVGYSALDAQLDKVTAGGELSVNIFCGIEHCVNQVQREIGADKDVIISVPH